MGCGDVCPLTEAWGSLDQGEECLFDQLDRTVTEKLLTFGLERGVVYFDAPAVRRIVREAEAEDYRWSALIAGIARSVPF